MMGRITKRLYIGGDGDTVVSVGDMADWQSVKGNRNANGEEREWKNKRQVEAYN